MKKKLAIVLCLAMLMTMFAVPAFAAGSAPTVVIDNQTVTFDVPPMIDNGRTLVPLRAIFEKMGATVTWDAATSTATAVKGSTTVVVVVGSVSPTINGTVKTIDVPARIIDGRTLAPMRFVCEAFGGTVTWDATTSTAKVVSAGTPATTPATPTTPTTPATTPATPTTPTTPATTPATPTTPTTPATTPATPTTPTATTPSTTTPVVATSIAPTAGTISKSAPADTPIKITWGSAKKVTKMLAGSPAYGLTYKPVEGTDYTVKDNGDGTGTFVIKKELANQLPVPISAVPTGSVMAITIQFDNGTAIDFTLTVAD